MIGAAPKLDDVRARAWTAAGAAFLLGFSVSFVWTATGTPMPLPWYEPLQHRWITATVAPTGVAMDWYTRVAIAFAFAALLGGATLAVTRRRAISETMLRALCIWAIGVTLLGMFLYAYALGTRVILPPHD